MNRNDQYLAHYGILGMKWGVRRYQNPDGTLTSSGQKRYQKEQKRANKKQEKKPTKKEKKKEAKELQKQIEKRTADLFIKSNNYAADRINGKWIEEFNNRWRKAFEGYDHWEDSPDYTKYEKAYFKKLSSLMNESLSKDPNAKITTKLGNTYTARYLEEYGGLFWATPKEWEEHDWDEIVRSKT